MTEKEATRLPCWKFTLPLGEYAPSGSSRPAVIDCPWAAVKLFVQWMLSLALVTPVRTALSVHVAVW